jgi:hypothetical protein
MMTRNKVPCQKGPGMPRRIDGAKSNVWSLMHSYHLLLFSALYCLLVSPAHAQQREDLQEAIEDNANLLEISATSSGQATGIFAGAVDDYCGQAVHG